jgi:hypothetical protein
VYKEFTYDPSDLVTMIRGKHILHFGGEFLFYQNNSTAWGNVNAGTFQFSGQYTQQWAVDPSTGLAGPVPGTGMEYADFLLDMRRAGLPAFRRNTGRASRHRRCLWKMTGRCART